MHDVNMNNINTLLNIQHTITNRPVKGLTLGSTDKCTTLLLLAWPISQFSTCKCFHTKQLFVNLHLLK